eukprot:765245-Hanusia_phi.AAC.3
MRSQIGCGGMKETREVQGKIAARSCKHSVTIASAMMAVETLEDDRFGMIHEDHLACYTHVTASSKIFIVVL